MKVGRKRKTGMDLPKRVYFKHGKYYWFVPPNMVELYGGRKWIPLGATKAEMYRAYAEIVEGDENGLYTLHAVWQRYRLQGMRDNAPATIADKERSWAELGPVFGNAHPDSVTVTDIANYLDARSSPRRATIEIALLSHMYTKAIRWGMATTNPCRGVERNSSESGSIRISDDHLRAWLNHCRPIVRLFTLLCYLTGRRPSDVLKTKRDQCQKDGIHFVESKTGKESVIPWTPAMAGAYRELRQTDSGALRFSPWVFAVTRRAKGSDGSYTYGGMSSLWQQDMKTFSGERFPPRALRAKYATDLENAGGDATKALMHSSRALTERHYLNGTKIVPGLDFEP